MNRTFIRRVQQSAGCGRENPEQVNIGVTGLGRSVGTTFVATSLAFYFAEKGNCVTYCQCLTPSEADKLLYECGGNGTTVYMPPVLRYLQNDIRGETGAGQKRIRKKRSAGFAGPMVLRRKSGTWMRIRRQDLLPVMTGESVFLICCEGQVGEF